MKTIEVTGKFDLNQVSRLVNQEYRSVPDSKGYWCGSNGVVLKRLKTRLKEVNGSVKSNDRRHVSLGSGGMPLGKVLGHTFHQDKHFSGAEADHIDNDKTNDVASNIQWLTRTQNARKQHGLDMFVSWVVISPDGNYYGINEPHNFANKHGIRPNTFSELLNESNVTTTIDGKTYNNTRKSVQGWKLYATITSTGAIYHS